MAELVDVICRGLDVVRRAKFEPASDGGFVEMETPLPVGTPLTVVLGDAVKEARVSGVVEHEASARSAPGMRLLWLDAAQTPEELASRRGRRNRKRR